MFTLLLQVPQLLLKSKEWLMLVSSWRGCQILPSPLW